MLKGQPTSKTNSCIPHDVDWIVAYKIMKSRGNGELMGFQCKGIWRLCAERFLYIFLTDWHPPSVIHLDIFLFFSCPCDCFSCFGFCGLRGWLKFFKVLCLCCSSPGLYSRSWTFNLPTTVFWSGHFACWFTVMWWQLNHFMSNVRPKMVVHTLKSFSAYLTRLLKYV